MTDSPSVPKQPKARAAALMLLASAFIACSVLLAKGASGRFEWLASEGDLHPVQITFGRFAFGALFWLTVSQVIRLKISTIHWRIHMRRTVFGFATVLCLFWASSAMVLADATAISFLNPVFTLLLAAVVLGERFGLVRTGAVLLMLLGALILLRPGTSAFQPMAIVALGAAIFGAVEAIVIKTLSGLENRFQILLINNLMGLVIASGFVLFFWTNPNPAQVLVLAGVGLSMAMAQLCFLTSMRGSEASFVVPFMYSTLVYASILDFWVFGDRPDLVGALGAAIIIIGGAFLAWREGWVQRHQAKENNA